jgi:ABC-type branched-subunit amino acid transport system substrate-binding protein
MILSKAYRIILFIISAFAFSNAIAQPQIKICLTGRVVENLQSYGQSFLNAAYLSKEINDHANQVVIKNYFYNNRPLEPMHVYDKMVLDGCSAIIGFEYLSDLLLAIKEQKSEKIPIFTSYASSTSTDKLPKNVFIFMPSYNFLANKMLAYLHAHFNKIQDVLLVTEINRDEMRKYKEVYSAALIKENTKYDTFDFLENDDAFEGKLTKFLTNKKYKYVFLLSGAIASAKIANIMNDHHTIFIGTENYGSSVSPTFFLRLNDKEIHSYFIRNLDFLKSNKALSEFDNLYTKKYHIKPTLLSVYTYDAANIILNSLEKSGSVNTDNVFHTNYSGITGAYLRNNKFYRSNNYVILSVGKDGYRYEK